MFKKNRPISIISTFLCCLLLMGLVWHFKSAHLWLFSSGTTNKAFLKTTFEMSVPEVERAVEMKLLTLEQYKTRKTTDGLVWDHDFEPLDKERYKKESRRFLADIMLFDVPADIEFGFFSEKLNNVSISFKLYSKEDARKLEETLSADLKKSWLSSEVEESKEVPGAYRIKYKKDYANAILWVNLTDERDLIISLDINYLPLIEAYKKSLASRNAAAF